MSMSYEEFGVLGAPIRDALLSIGEAVDDYGLEKTLTELVKLRASQINGCAFCIALHLKIARRLGIAEGKLDLLSVWRDTALFNPREQVALALTETLTNLDNPRAHTEAALNEHFATGEIVHLVATIGTINQWNRIAIGLQFPPSLG